MQQQPRTSRLQRPGPGPSTLHDAAVAPVDGAVVGTVLGGRYRIGECLGAGAMGVVWAAWDRRLRRTVAVKQLAARGHRDATEERIARARAMREGRIAARVVHPRAIAVFDVVVDGDQGAGRGPWLVMEYLPSRSLAALIAENGPLEPAEAAWVGAQIADALGAVHEAGIVHGDIKPGNILITDDGVAKITDFGVSRATWDTTSTGGGMVAGTPGYFAPEVARGGEPTSASDVFSLGATLYAAVENELVCGHHDNTLAVLHAMAEGRLRPATRAGVLGRPLAAMLRLDPEHRPGTAAVERALRARAGTRPFLPAPRRIEDAGEDPEELPAQDPAQVPAPRRAVTGDLPATVPPDAPADDDAPAPRDAADATPRDPAAADGESPDVAAPVAATPGDQPDAPSAGAGSVPDGAGGAAAGGGVPAGPPVVEPERVTVAPVSALVPRPVTPGLAAGDLDGPSSAGRVGSPAAAAVAWSPAHPGASTTTRSPRAAPGAGTDRRAGRRVPRRAALVAAAASAVVLAGGIGAAMAVGGHRGALAAPSTPAASTAAPAPVDPLGAAPVSPTPTPRVAAPLSPIDPADPAPTDPGAVVVDYYSSLPGDIDGAWAVLSDRARDDSGGYDGYRHFWSGIREVHATNVSVHDDTVFADIEFTTASGRTSRESYRFLVDCDADGRMRIQRAERSSDSS